MHERTASPLMMTVHAPHWPSPQPNRGPCRFKSFRSTYNSGVATKNRLMMAPMTRSRALAGGVPSDLAIEYYAQRASAGVIVTEGVAPVAVGLGYARTPTAETPEQMAVWAKIADAVHAKGG